MVMLASANSFCESCTSPAWNRSWCPARISPTSSRRPRVCFSSLPASSNSWRCTARIVLALYRMTSRHNLSAFSRAKSFAEKDCRIESAIRSRLAVGSFVFPVFLALFNGIYHLPGSQLHVVGRHHGADYGDCIRARVDHGRYIVLVDSTYGHQRYLHFFPHPAQPLQSYHYRVVLGPCRIHRAYSHVVRALSFSLLSLFDGPCGASQHGAYRQQPTGHVQRKVRLSQVQALGADRQRYVDPVVHHEHCPGSLAQQLQLLRHRQQVTHAASLVAKLDNARPAAYGLPGDLGLGAPVEPFRVQHQVQALHPRAPSLPQRTGEQLLLDVINSESCSLEDLPVDAFEAG